MERVKDMRTEWLKTLLAAGLVLVVTGWGGVGAAELEDEEEVLVEPGPGGDGPMGFEPGPEQVEQMLARIREKDPQKADELVQLQEKDPAAFKAELRKAAREHFMNRTMEHRGEPDKWQPRPGSGLRRGERGSEGMMPGGYGVGSGPEMGCNMPFADMGPQMREQMQERDAEYAKWLEENYPDEAAKLERLKEGNPGRCMRAMGLSWKKYGRIYQASKDNPELAKVLKEQIALKERRVELLRQIKATTDEKQKKELTGELEQVVGQQFDLIVRRKEIAYEGLAKKLAELQTEVEQKKAEVEKWKSKDFKNEQVKQRVKELINETEKFEWEN